MECHQFLFSSFCFYSDWLQWRVGFHRPGPAPGRPIGDLQAGIHDARSAAGLPRLPSTVIDVGSGGGCSRYSFPPHVPHARPPSVQKRQLCSDEKPKEFKTVLIFPGCSFDLTRGWFVFGDVFFSLYINCTSLVSKPRVCFHVDMQRKGRASCFPRPLTPKNKNILSGPQPALSPVSTNTVRSFPQKRDGSMSCLICFFFRLTEDSP